MRPGSRGRARWHKFNRMGKQMGREGAASGPVGTGAQAVVRFYLWAGGLSLLLMAWLTPPFQVPDEPQHFYRSYQLSQGDVRSSVRNGEAGAELPASLSELVRHFLGSTAHHLDDRRIKPQPAADTFSQFAVPLEPERKEFIDFSGSALYAPLPYLPQAAVMAVLRPTGVGPLGLMYAGRMANALAALAVTAWALSMLRSGRLVALVIALLPMTQFVTASLSPDALTIACGLALGALLLRFIEDGRWSWRHQLGFVVHGLVLSIGKLVYLPMLLGGLAALVGRTRWRDQGVRKAVAWQIAGVVVVVAVIAGWLALRPSGMAAPRPGVDAAAQAAYLKTDPTLPLRIVLRSIIKEADFLVETLSGRLGWLTLPLPGWIHVTVALAGVASLFGTGWRGLTRAQALWGGAWLLTLSAACVALVELALYLIWTPVGNYSALGVQGRYFTPMLLMPVAALSWAAASMTQERLAALADRAVPWLLLAASLGTHCVVATAYGVL